MANEHPFQLLFESFGRLPVAHAESVNRRAYEELIDVLESPIEGSGRCILLRAPRAGHGKTHLLSRVQYQLGGTHEFIPLHAAGSRIDAASATEDALKRLSRSLPAAGGLTVLDLVVRRLFAFALQPLVISGEVPCQDREGALTALKSRPVETFDFHHPNAVTAHWARENFEVLGPRLSLELAHRSGVAIREVSFWVNAFFRYAATPIDHPGRTSVLALEVAGGGSTEGVAMERFIALLGLLSLLMRVVLVADDLEGFSADETAALRFAAFIGAIRQSVDRADVILSLNKDVWENAFVPRLSGGLADRLSEVLIELQPLTDEDIVALFDSRAPGLGGQVLERVDVSERHARGLIRAAGEAWLRAANEKRRIISEPAPAIESAAVAAATTSAEDEPAEAAEEPAEEKPADPPISGEPVGETGPFHAAVTEPIFPIDEIQPGEPELRIDPAFQRPGGSIFDAHVVQEPEAREPFSQAWSEPAEDPVETIRDFTPESSPFIAVAETPAAEAGNSPEQDIFQEPQQPKFVSLGEPSPFVAVSDIPSAELAYQTPAQTPEDFGPTRFSPPPAEAEAAEENPDRVDDLLRQFRERYGRGSL